MAWQTHQNTNVFNRSPQEPDLETLVYWVQRLEPLIRAENEEEIIVVFCNRTGTEDDATYTGTSAVIGVKQGEVLVYGVLGRGENNLLIVDTDLPPRSKLTDADGIDAEDNLTEEIASDTALQNGNTEKIPETIPGKTSTEEPRRPHHLELVTTNSPPIPSTTTPRTASSPRLPWLALPDELPTDQIPTNNRSPTRLQIPTSPDFNKFLSMDSAITDILIDSPDSHSPGGSAFPRSARPDGTSTYSTFRPPRSARIRLSASGSAPASPAWRFPHANKLTPYPWHHQRHYNDGSRTPGVFGGGATMTPITPFDEDGFFGGGGGGGGNLTPIDPKTPGWFWRHEHKLGVLTETVLEEEEEEEEGEGEEDEKRKGTGKEEGGGERGEGNREAKGLGSLSQANAEQKREHGRLTGYERGERDDNSNHAKEQRNDVDRLKVPTRIEEPPSPAALSAASPSTDWADLANVLKGLQVSSSQRPSPAASSGLDLDNHRPSAPKHLNLAASSPDTATRQPQRFSPAQYEEGQQWEDTATRRPQGASPTQYEGYEEERQWEDKATRRSQRFSPGQYEEEQQQPQWETSTYSNRREDAPYSNRWQGGTPSVKRPQETERQGENRTWREFIQGRGGSKSTDRVDRAGNGDGHGERTRQGDNRTGRALTQHAISLPDEEEDEEIENDGTDYAPDRGGHYFTFNFDDARHRQRQPPRNVSRGRQPGPGSGGMTAVERWNSVVVQADGDEEGDDVSPASMQHPTPSLCSTTSVSTFDDSRSELATPKLGGFGGGDLVVVREGSLVASVLEDEKRDVWVGIQVQGKGNWA